MRTRRRVTVTVPLDALAVAEADVAAGHATSVSSWVSDAMQSKARAEALGAVVRQIAVESGSPLTDEEMRWAQERLDRSSSTLAG